MLKYIVAFLVAVPVFGIGQADCQSGWQAVRIDGGGFVTGIDIECDQGMRACSPGVGTVTKVIRTDTAAAWLWDIDKGTWKQIVTKQSFPDAGFGDFYGACEIRISPSNTNHLYLYFTLGAGNKTAGFVFESLNKGATWTRTGFSSVPCDAANSGAPQGKQLGSKIGVAPNNDAVLYVGTESKGVYYTTNGGQGARTTFAQISTDTIPGGGGNWNLIAFDPSDGTGNTVYISSNGHGIWKCTNAASAPSCSELNSSGMPTTFENILVDRNGTLWVVDDPSKSNNGNLWKYVDGIWTEVISAKNTRHISAVAVDPANSSHVFAADYHGYVSYSTNAGRSFGIAATMTEISARNPWMARANDSSIAVAALAFDPTQSSVLYAAGGTGVWSTTPPTSGSVVTWDGSPTVGIENLVATTGVSPPGGPVMLAAWDRALWLISNPESPQSNYLPFYSPSGFIDPGWSASFNISSPTMLYVLDQSHGLVYSTDNGAVGSWRVPSSLPSAFPRTGLGGNFAAYSDTSAVWVMGGAPGGPYCLIGGSITSSPVWSGCSFNNGTTVDGGGWIENYRLTKWTIAVDTVAAHTYCLYNDGSGTNERGFYELTDGKVFSFQATTGSIEGGNQFSLFAVPGQRGHFFAGSPPDVHGRLPDANIHLWRTTSGCGGRWSKVPNVESVFGYGFGKAGPSSDGYPALYCACWVNKGRGFTYGIWRADNIDGQLPIWTQIGDGFPNGNFDWIKFVTGDMNVYGRVYVGFDGSGFAYRNLD